MEVTIREARADDYKEIHRLNSEAFGYEYDLEKTKERLAYIIQRPENRVFVAVADENICGYIHAADYECIYSDSLKNIMAIAVDQNKRGLGVGKQLLEEIENWAKRCGCAGVRLVSGFNRQEAHKFYLACGYTVRKDQRNFIKIFMG